MEDREQIVHKYVWTRLNEMYAENADGKQAVIGGIEVKINMGKTFLRYAKKGLAHEAKGLQTRKDVLQKIQELEDICDVGRLMHLLNTKSKALKALKVLKIECLVARCVGARCITFNSDLHRYAEAGIQTEAELKTVQDLKIETRWRRSELEDYADYPWASDMKAKGKLCFCDGYHEW